MLLAYPCRSAWQLRLRQLVRFDSESMWGPCCARGAPCAGAYVACGAAVLSMDGCLAAAASGVAWRQHVRVGALKAALREQVLPGGGEHRQAMCNPD